VRQESIGPYFIDFVCREHKLGIEVDGATHAAPDNTPRDVRRDADLAERGYQDMRVSNDEVTTNLDGVLDTSMATLNLTATTKFAPAAAPHPSPLSAGEKGQQPP